MPHGFKKDRFLEMLLLWLWCLLAPVFVNSTYTPFKIACSRFKLIGIYYGCAEDIAFRSANKTNTPKESHSESYVYTCTEESDLDHVNANKNNLLEELNTTSKGSSENKQEEVEKYNISLHTALKNVSEISNNEAINVFEEMLQHYFKMSPEERRRTNLLEAVLAKVDDYLGTEKALSNRNVEKVAEFGSWVLNYTQRMTSLIASDLLPGTNRIIRGGKSVIHAINIDTAAGQSAKFQGSPAVSKDELQDAFEIPFRDIQSLGAYVLAGFVVSESVRIWLHPVNSSETLVSSRVVSAFLEGLSDGLAEPVRFTLAHLNSRTLPATSPRCSFWRPVDAHWLTSGCAVEWTNQTHTSCRCSHLTSFAVLMSLDRYHDESDSQVALTVITKVLLSLSVVALLLSFITFVTFKSLKSDRNTIHINLVLTLASGQLVFLLGIEQVEHRTVCAVIAGFLHFLFLCAFCWMLMEGLEIFLKMVIVYNSMFSWVPIYFAIGYGVPIFIVAVTAGINHKGYGTDRFCWLTMEKNFHWSFAGPVIVILVFNIVILFVTVRLIHHHMSLGPREERAAGKRMSRMIKGCLSLSVLLGTSWLFGVFQIGSVRTVMDYIFTILNCAQGLFIFGFHCLWNIRVRVEYLKVLVGHNLVSPETVSSYLRTISPDAFVLLQQRPSRKASSLTTKTTILNIPTMTQQSSD